ncbi:hypothetical protein H5410_020857, partial [Solanum commersonii]
MTNSKVNERITPTQEKSKGIAIKEDTVTSKEKLERVNTSPSPIHSAQESEWAKAKVVLNAATRCSRETELIR